MIPLPPLDGRKVAAGLFPKVLGERLAGFERFDFLLVIGGVLLILPRLGSMTRQMRRSIHRPGIMS